MTNGGDRMQRAEPTDTSTGAAFTDLVCRAARRDKAAAAELVRRFEPELRRIVRFQLTDPWMRRFMDSLDVCQSVLAGFFAQLHAGELRLEKPQQVAALLGLMARHKVVDRARHHRAARRGGGRHGAEEMLQGVADQRTLPDDLAANRDLLDAVRGRLPEPERAILDRWLSGREWPEIAGELGGSPEALRKRLSRAIDDVAGRMGLVEETT